LINAGFFKFTGMVSDFSKRIVDQIKSITQAPIAIALLDNNLRYIAHSSKWSDDFNLAYTNIKEMYHYGPFPALSNEWKKVQQRVLKGSEESYDEELLITTDGKQRWIKWNMKPWRNFHNDITGVIMVTEDVTEAVQLKRRNQYKCDLRFKKCLPKHIGTWEYDHIKGELRWSKGTRAIHKTPKEFIPKADEALNFYKSGESRKKITEAFLRAITMGTSYDLELELTTAKGTPIWVRAVGISEFINGICLRQYGTLEDITSRINRE
jgi:PAS domain S-box-containing protein